MKLKYQERIDVQTKKQALLEEVENLDKELDLDLDTYSMAFKAMHWDSMKQLDLTNSEVHDAFSNAIFVFLI